MCIIANSDKENCYIIQNFIYNCELYNTPTHVQGIIPYNTLDGPFLFFNTIF